MPHVYGHLAMELASNCGQLNILMLFVDAGAICNAERNEVIFQTYYALDVNPIAARRRLILNVRFIVSEFSSKMEYIVVHV